MTTATKKKNGQGKATGDKYFNLIEHAADGIAIIQDGVFKMVNTALIGMSGHNEEELLGMPFTQILTPQSQKLTMERYRARIAGKEVPQIYEVQAITKDGKMRDIEVNAALTEYEGRVADEIIIRDITERKQAEQALDDEATRRRILIDQSLDGIVILDENAKVYEANQKFAEMLGYTPTEVRELYTWDWDTQWSREELLEMGRNVDETGYHVETYHRRKDGSTIDVEISINGAVVAGQKLIFCVCRDITERKRAEEVLRESENKYRTIFENVSEVIIRLDKYGKVIDINGRAEECFGYEPEEVIGKNFAKLGVLKLKDTPKLVKLFSEIIRGKRAPFTIELEAKRKDGSPVTIEVNNTLVKKDGKAEGFVSIVRDITERKQAEEALQTERNKLKSVIDAMADGLSIQDRDFNIIYQNKPSKIGAGHDCLGEKCYQAYENRDKVCDGCPVKKAFKDGKSHTAERSHVTPSGEVTFWENTASPVRDAQGNIASCLEITRDISERKRAEQTLQESEQYLKTLFDATTGGILVIDPQTHRIVDANPAISQIMGIPQDQIIGHVCHRFVCPAELGQCPITDLKQEMDTKECKILNANGEELSILKSVVPITRQGCQYLLELVFDITERKRAEEALRESEERYRAVIEGAHDMIQSVALDGSINFVNQAWLDALGYTKEDLPKLNLLDLISPESCPHCQEMFAKVIEGEPAHNVQATFLTKDGRKILVEGNAAPRYIGDKAVATQGIFRDITERKQMEQQLQEKHEQLDAQNEELRTINEELQATEEELQNSQERLERMFESVTDGISVINLNGIITKVNERSVQMHGFASEDDMLGRNAFDLVTPQDHQRIAADIRKALKEGVIRGGEYTMLRVDGTEFPGELSTSVLKDGLGNVIGHISIARDITYRKQMEELFKTVTNSSPVGIYILQNGKFQLANPQFQKLTGYSEEELAKIDPMTLVLPEDRDMLRKKAVKMLKGARSSPYQFRVVNKAGETRWVMETVTSIQYRGRRATLGNYIDITERKQAEEREDQLQQELNLAGRLASIGQLAAGVAHEINNPLTGVIGFSHLMLSRDIPDDMRKDLQVIHSEAQRVAKIVENLLVFAHQRKTGREYLAINDIITRVLELRSYEMKVNNIEVENQLDPELPATMADAGQLQQVFLNIVLNAEHFMTKAHYKGKLLVKTERLGNKIRASFTDDGTGISQENLDKIFNPFFTTKEVGKGTGLGLSICHGIITQHEGRIYAESESGKGATFVIELPVVAEPVRAGKAKVTKKEPPKPRGAKILVVDDEAAILTFLHRLLTDMGHSVETINNADAALERLKTERYSLILLDIKLPGMSGIELYQQIEKIAPALTRRVMFITGDVMEGTTRSFLEKAGVPHITKPIDIEELKKMMNNALNQTQGASKASG